MLTTILLTPMFLPSAPVVEDWPQWRGPNRDGISTETAWETKGKSEPLWTADVGLGYSTFSIADGRLYTAGWDEESGGDIVYCLDAKTGKEVWQHKYAAEKWAKFHDGGTNCTPSVDGDHVYVLNREGRYTQFDAKSGEVNWQVDLKAEYELELPTWGFSASPLILDDMIVVHVGKVLAFKKDSTKLLWKSEDYGHAYSTPTACKLGGKNVLAVMGGKALVLLDARSGRELAQSKWETKYDVNAASPVKVDDERVWISSGYGHGGAMVRFDGKKCEELWSTKEMKNHMATSILIGEHLYGIDEAVLKCFDLDGNEKWSQRGIGKGALSAAGDRLLVHTGKGELAVVRANPEEYEELARDKVTSGGVCWTMPILVDGRIYLRSSQGELVVRDHRTGN